MHAFRYKTRQELSLNSMFGFFCVIIIIIIIIMPGQFYGAVIMTPGVIARVHMVHAMNAE